MRLEQDRPDQSRRWFSRSWFSPGNRIVQRWQAMSARRRAGTVGALLFLANEVRGVIVVITIGLEPLRVMLAAI